MMWGSQTISLRAQSKRIAALATVATSALALSTPASAQDAQAEPLGRSFDIGAAFDAEFAPSPASAVPGTITLLPEDLLAYASDGGASAAPLIGLQSAGNAAASAKSPIKARLVVSQFLDIPVAGDADSILRYSGRADAYIDVAGSALGLDDSWTLTFRPEVTWGETSNGEIGLIPTNTALFRREGVDDYDLSVSVRKRWAGGVNLTLGKINILDWVGTLPIVGSDGHYGFQNLGIALPPTAILPNTITGGILEVPTKNVIYRLYVFDPDSQYGRTGFETAFESGVGFLGAATFLTRFGGKPGFYTAAVAASTRSGFSQDLLPSALTPPLDGEFGNESGELALQLSAYQFLKLYPEAPGKGWGILARFQASKGDPTFLDYSGYFGIAGNPRKRPNDRFGLAFFQYSLTDELVDDIAFRLPLEDERGVEAFYTFGLYKGFELTMNAQLIDSAVEFRDTGVLVGGRLTAGF